MYGPGRSSRYLGETQPDPATGRRLNPLPDKPRPSCSCMKFGQEPVTQKLYRCLTCKMSPCAVICPGCAAFCHSGHNVESIGSAYGVCACGAGSKNCYCYLMNPVEGDEDFEPGQYRQCRFLYTGPNWERGIMSQCVGCGQGTDRDACVACVKLCHKGHNVVNHGMREYFCDCGAEPDRWHCKIMPKATGEVTHCSRFITKSDKAERTLTRYICTRCGVEVCDSCMMKCHNGHGSVRTTSSSPCQCPDGTCVDIKNKEPAA